MTRTSAFTRALLAAIILLAIVSPGHAAPSGDVVITGKVLTSRGQALFGAGVDVEALAVRVGTAEDGTYRLVLPARARGRTVVVRARLFGYAPRTTQVLLDRDSIVVNFSLATDLNRLSQVVVTGTAQGRGRAKMPFRVGSGAGAAQPARDLSGEEYAQIFDNSFRSPRVAPLSTFGVDVDRASYSNVRRIISVDRQRPPRDAVRIEEFVNYFPYEYAQPTGEHPFAVQTDVTVAPWAPEHLLVRIGLRARSLDLSAAPANNLVFLIDVSGSMASDDKLPLLKQAFRLLVAQLREQDRVAIVTYAGSEGLALPSTPGTHRNAFLDAIDRLEAGGSTAGGAGIVLAYKIARENFIPNGNNRVILATDGDFNVGISNMGELEQLIAARRAEGTALTVLGFGAGNLQDARMEMLADKGNGNYSYIDSPLEARKVLVHEIGGTLVTVAQDVKLQVEFNPAVVAGYRLIGYENRLLNDEDFKDDTKDAGDIGAGHTVTAMYEIIPVGTRDARRIRLPDSLRYTRTSGTPAIAAATSELMYVRLRYKVPNDSTSIPMELVVPNRVVEASGDFRFAQAVAAFGMALRNSEHRGTSTPALALKLAEGALGTDPFGYRREFVSLVTSYIALSRGSEREGRR